jgi:ketosteroid isomerase-like protein
MTNGDTVHEMVAAFGRRDLAASAAALHPDIVWDASRVIADDLRGVYHGLDGVAEFWRSWLDAWDTIETGEYEVLENGDRVLQWIWAQKNTGRGSGFEVIQPAYGLLWTFRDGQAVRMELHTDRAEALAAAGLD